MSEINPVTSTGTTTTTSSSAIDTDTFSEDFDAFLQLLTAQIQNQDPVRKGPCRPNTLPKTASRSSLRPIRPSITMKRS